jgi:diguanylate cyclase (GGDEF)-like protein
LERGIKLPGLQTLSGLRWGIGARLGLAFAAVAGLAVAANLLTQHEIAVINTTRIVPVAVPVASPIAPVRQAAPPPGQVKVIESEGVIAAIEQYEDAARSQTLVHNEDSDNRFDDATRALRGATQAFAVQSPGTISPATLRTLRERLDTYGSHGDELSRIADARQDQLAAISSHLESLDVHLRSSIDRAWKILGRVIARKSLIDLKSELDEVRRQFASLPATEDFDIEALSGLTKSESVLEATLEKSARDLSESQGEPWVSQMRTELADLHDLQAILTQTDEHRRSSLENLGHESQDLIAFVRSIKPPRPPPTVASRAPDDQTTLLADVLHSTPTPSLERTIESTSTSNTQSRHATLIRWISGVVLVLMLIVSIWTVMSIVGPVRRIRSATRRLAAGEIDVKVQRGGIQELDDLAVSFNQMAEQLSQAQALRRTYQDQLEAKVAQRTRELQHLAEHDPLTQLPNRRQLFTHLTDAIDRASNLGACVGVFFLDLDNFKNINDSMGHAFGDRVLEAIAEQLRATAGPGGFAARLGGDEFTVVCDDARNQDDVRRVGGELVRAFQRPISINGRDLAVSISVGASIYPDHGVDAESLLRAADAALFRAKALGRSQLAVFSPELLEAASNKFSTEQGLRRAMEHGDLELVFQPEIDATTFETALVEALLRWRLPDGRLASPGEFLGVAEESGLIMEMSDWVLRTAVETAAGWHHGAWPNARVAINLSSRQLLDNRFVDRVTELLRQYELPPHCIEIELTENVLQTGQATVEVLRCLRACGIAIALDDFGTGYSSLASLEQLPLTRVKLDRALIASIHTSARSAAIARAIIGLCHSLGLEVTAEGIECTEQLALLLDQAPLYLQGYLLARPADSTHLLSTMESLPQHMESLLLTFPPQAPAAADEGGSKRRASRGRAN